MARSTPNTHTTLKNTAQRHPDALLLRLMAKHAKAQTRVEAAEAALESGAASMSDRLLPSLL
jgi:hypothetical protein